ncbi:MAG: DUF1934 domain-containing protein [Clostridia bacterium]|nr:DUF1934 domain-containing protein [Clostridia bacterium]
MKSIKKRNAKLKILSQVVHYDAEESETRGSSDIRSESAQKPTVENITLTTDCTVALKGDRFEIEYAESELTGMEGAATKIYFDAVNPRLVSLLREGSVRTALVFEEGKRHHCVYETPYFPIELCVDTLALDNTLTFGGGRFFAEYLIEMNGILAEKTKISITLVG